MPAVRADQLLEGRDLAELGPVGAVDHQVGAVGEAVGAAQVLGRVAARRAASGSSPSTRSSIEVVGPIRADGDRPVALGADQDEADPGMVREAPGRGADRGLRSAPASTRPGSRGKLINPRQPEAITESSGSSSPCASARSPGVESGSSATAPSARRSRVAARTVRPAAGVVAGDLGQPGAEVGERVVVAAFDRDRAVGLAGRADQLPRASGRSGRGRSRPATGRGRRGRRGGRDAARRAQAAAIRAIWRSRSRSTASASWRSIPEWWATSS